MNESTPAYTRLRQLRAPDPADDDVRERRRDRATSHTRKRELASSTYSAQVDSVLKRIRHENNFGAMMIRSILGHDMLRSSSR